jgi:nicotinic acid mononucleotide adenylyltransferase
LFVPAGSPPHKSALLPAAVRWAGVQATLAWAADARLQASPVELDAAAVASEPTYYTYTSHTLRRLLGLPLSAPLPMGLPVLMGQDCFETLATWHEAAHLLERLQCWVYPRGEEDGQAQREAPPSQPWYQTPAVAALVAQGAQLHPLQGPALPVSATLLRAALHSQPTAAQQALLQQWLAPAVLQALVAL